MFQTLWKKLKIFLVLDVKKENENMKIEIDYFEYRLYDVNDHIEIAWDIKQLSDNGADLKSYSLHVIKEKNGIPQNAIAISRLLNNYFLSFFRFISILGNTREN